MSYYKKKTRVKHHNRFDPRIGKKVEVNSYDRDQRYRKWESVSREDAIKRFEQYSEKAKSMDRRKTSKKVFDDPNEYWFEHTNRSDVKGIDTKLLTDKESLKQQIEKNLKKAEQFKKKMAEIKKPLDKERLIANFKKLKVETDKLIDTLSEIENQEIKKRKAQLKEKRKGTLESDRKVILEMKQKLLRTIKGKYNKKIWEEQKIQEIGEYDTLGVMDSSKITFLTTNRQFEGSMLDRQTKNRKEMKNFDLGKTKFIMGSNDLLYEFDNEKECGYDKEYIDRAMKNFKNPKVYYKQNKPLVIQGEVFSYAIAPRDYDSAVVFDEDYLDDDNELDKERMKKKDIELTPSQYKKLMKYNKTKLVEKVKELEKYDVLYKPYDPKKKTKHEVLYDLLHNVQDIPEKKKQQEKFVKDIVNLGREKAKMMSQEKAKLKQGS